MKNRLHLSEQQWLRLRDYASIKAHSIREKIPADWNLSLDDIEGAIFDEIVKLLDEYKAGPTSPTTYCCKWAERRALNSLMREYKRLKSQIEESDILDEGDDDCIKPQVGRGDVKALSVDERDMRETQMLVRLLLELATPEDRVIMEDILRGDSYEEISKAHNIGKMTITRKMRRYAAMLAS